MGGGVARDCRRGQRWTWHPHDLAKYQSYPSPRLPKTSCHVLKDRGTESQVVRLVRAWRSVGLESNFDDEGNEVQKTEEITQDHTVSQNPRSFFSLPVLTY